MSSITDAYLVAHATEFRLAMSLLAIVAGFATVSLALSAEETVQSLRARMAASGTGRLAAVGAR